MTEYITHAHDATPEDATDVLGLSLQDLLDGGIDEGIAREHLGIGTDEAKKGQLDKFAARPDAYYLYRGEGGSVKAMLKVTPRTRLDDKHYSVNSVDKFIRNAELATIHNLFSKRRLAYQALVASNTIDQDHAIDMLISRMLDDYDDAQLQQDIIVPLHESDPAMPAAIRHGFTPTDMKARSVDLVTHKGIVTVLMEQRLFVRKVQ